MPRQILDALAKLDEFLDARMLDVEAGIAAMALKAIAIVFEFPSVHQIGESPERFEIKRKRLPNFARRRAPAICDHVRRHRCAEPSIALVNILNGALSLVAARQIKINVRPFVTFLGKKSLEKQIHAHGIDGRDPQRVANGAVGRRTAPLHQNIPLAAEANDVPDDEEIAGEIELFDQREFAFELPPRFFIICAIARQHSFHRAPPEKRILRLAFAHGIFRKFVAEILQRKFEPRGKLFRLRDGFR